MERVIETPRLTLRPFTTSDLPAFLPLVMDKAVAVPAGFAPARDRPEAMYMLRQTVANPTARALVWKQTAQVIGYISLFERIGAHGEPEETAADLGYALLPAQWGQRLMVEAGEAYLEALAQAGNFATIWASCLADNVRSKRVLQHLHFTQVDEIVHSEVALVHAGQTELVFQRSLD